MQSLRGLTQQPTEMDPVTGKPLQPSPAVPTTSALSSPGTPATVGRSPDQQGANYPADGGAETYPMGAKPGPGLEVSDVGGGQAAGSGFDVEKDRGPAGTTVQRKAQENPEAIVKAAEEAMHTATSTVGNKDDNAAQLQELSKKLGVTGKTLEQLTEQFLVGGDRSVQDGITDAKHYTKLKDRWKNVFQFIGKDEMGLFLIDFGMRAMMAGESMGTMGALGAAGSGALGALQGRRRQSYEDEIAMRDKAGESALEQYKAESGRMEAGAAVKRADTDKEYKDSLTESRDAGYRGEKVFMQDRLRAEGVPEDEINSLLLGDLSPEEKVTRIVENLQKKQLASPYDTDPITGKEYGEMGRADMERYAMELLEMQKAIVKNYREQQARAAAAQKHIDKAAGK